MVKGSHLTQEQKARISLANKGKKRTPEQKERYRLSKLGNKNPFYGKELSEEHKVKIRRNSTRFWLGKNRSPETIEKNRLAHLGKIPSEVTRRKMGLSHLGRKHSLKTRLKLSLQRRGEKCRWWKGGVSEKNKIIRSSAEYKFWRESVFKRDNWKCIFCNSRSIKGKNVILNADHIKPFCDYPELRFSIDNGRTLCLDCHRKTDSWGKNKVFKSPIPIGSL